MPKLTPCPRGLYEKGIGRMERSTDETAAKVRGRNVLSGDFLQPCAVLKDTALAANSAMMRAFLKLTGAEIWPHGKTTMSPELMARQIADGARGITAATVHHMEVMALHGHRHILIANQVVGIAELRQVSAALNAYDDLELMVLADSLRGVEILQEGLSLEPGRKLSVLLEMGRLGARTGVRSVEEGLQVARAIARAPNLALVGVEAYEGIVPGADTGQVESGIDEMLSAAVQLAEKLSEADLYATDKVILTAGGSAYYDLAAQGLSTARIKAGKRIIVRSGCYLTHDDGWLAKYHVRMQERSPQLARSLPAPRAALEVWSHIQSRPEPGLAFATLGKRDASYDMDLPTPLSWYRRGTHARPEPIPTGHSLFALNDQHAYLRIPTSSPLQVGDLVSFGVSHPCTTFDKWRVIPVVDDDYTIKELITTWF